MQIADLVFDIPEGPSPLRLREKVLLHFDAHRQTTLCAKEAGGQLFARLTDDGSLDICEVTGPRPTDKRSRFQYVPDRAAERIEIANRYEQGFHFVGDWHTHAQNHPRPSTTDKNSMREMAELSVHGFAGFILVIVGRQAFPAGLHVSFHTRQGEQLLVPRP